MSDDLIQLLGSSTPPFIIAEMSGNHNQSLEVALDIVRAAALAGVHAIKLQTYTAESMTLDVNKPEFCISENKSLWSGLSLFKLYQQASTPWEWHKPIFELAQSLGLIVFSSPFSSQAVDFLEALDAPIYKIPSFELTDIPLIQKAAATGKPLIMSTGMASASDIDEAVVAARNAGAKDIVLLKCTSAYPTSPEDSHLLTIPHMRQLFRCEVGLSDHTLGIGAAIASVALGASVIEKHFTLDRQLGGVDSAFSLEPDEMAMLVKESQVAWQALGSVYYGPTAGEQNAVNRRRSLYISENLKAGDILTLENIKAIRPGYGLAPKYLPYILDMQIKYDVEKGTPLSWDLLK